MHLIQFVVVFACCSCSGNIIDRVMCLAVFVRSQTWMGKHSQQRLAQDFHFLQKLTFSPSQSAADLNRTTFYDLNLFVS